MFKKLKEWFSVEQIQYADFYEHAKVVILREKENGRSTFEAPFSGYFRKEDISSGIKRLEAEFGVVIHIVEGLRGDNLRVRKTCPCCGVPEGATYF